MKVRPARLDARRSSRIPTGIAGTVLRASSRSLTLIALILVALSGCVPLFLPPVPSDVLAPAPSWRVAGDTELRIVRDGDGRVAYLRLRLRFDEVPAPAWVAVQWFGPAGGERASGSLWVTPADAGRTLSSDTPPDLGLTPGPWRAVVSVGDRLLRQLDVVVGIAGDDEEGAPAP